MVEQRVGELYGNLTNYLMSGHDDQARITALQIQALRDSFNRLPEVVKRIASDQARLRERTKMEDNARKRLEEAEKSGY